MKVFQMQMFLTIFTVLKLRNVFQPVRLKIPWFISKSNQLKLTMVKKMIFCKPVYT